MKPAKNSNIENFSQEPRGLRILRILTVTMTIVMTIGFIVIVSLLSIAIKKNLSSNAIIENFNTVTLAEGELLESITYSSEYTILLIGNAANEKILRILSNKTGKILNNSLISELISEDSKK